MTVYVTSFGIDLSHKIVGNKTPHHSKTPLQGNKNRYPIFRPIKPVSYDRLKTEKGLIYVNVEKGYKFVNRRK